MNNSIHALWLTLVEIAASNIEKFRPTADEQGRISQLASAANIDDERLGHLIDKARRFAQVQVAIQGLTDAQATFNVFERRLAKLENARAHVVNQIKANRRAMLRLQTLRSESESIQQAIARMKVG